MKILRDHARTNPAEAMTKLDIVVFFFMGSKREVLHLAEAPNISIGAFGPASESKRSLTAHLANEAPRHQYLAVWLMNLREDPLHHPSSSHCKLLLLFFLRRFYGDQVFEDEIHDFSSKFKIDSAVRFTWVASSHLSFSVFRRFLLSDWVAGLFYMMKSLFTI